jgi:hypothetical protein
MSTPRRTSRKAFAFEAGSEDPGKDRLPTCLEERLLIGTDIGLRYHYADRSLRADARVPLDRRSDVDDMFQIYVSIGQAF